MFHELRRKDRSLSLEDTMLLLQHGEYGVLSMSGKYYPYGVPVNYAYDDGAVYFHSAVTGDKLERITKYPMVSFCVVGKTQVLQGNFTTNYESVILFGKAVEVSGEEKRKGLELILRKYSPDFISKGIAYIEKTGDGVKVIKITIDYLAGKGRK